MKLVTLAALTAVTTALAAVAWLLLVYPRTPGTGRGRTAELDLAALQTIDRAAARLAQEHLVSDARLFVAYVRLLGGDVRLRAGRVQIDDRMSPAEVARAIALGLGRARVRVTIPEGLTRFDVAERLDRLGVCDREGFLAATTDRELLRPLGVDADSAEGYLFPDTYELPTDSAPERIARRMITTFRLAVGPLVESRPEGLASLRARLGFGMHEVVTLASIVEKEAAVAEERPVIAGVFLNRLTSAEFHPRRLQADPTVSYGCRARPDVSAACREFDGRDITRAMLRDTENPYNTYRIEGLPPGPIASPGRDSIRAVLAPATHDYLYFVARGGGRHQFSRSLEQHESAVDRYQVSPAQR